MMVATPTPLHRDARRGVLLGVNIDHVATIRNARGGCHPSPLLAARIAEAHGADGITVHLREDRRHIKDHDLDVLRAEIKTRLNLEMANTPEMVQIACRVKPNMVTLVPERRQEVTTEGGLDVARLWQELYPSVQTLHEAGILVSLFIDPTPAQLEATVKTGAQWVELHTGRYAESHNPETGVPGPDTLDTLNELMAAARLAQDLHLHLNAGHGLNYDNVRPILAMPDLVELNIGHSIVAQAVFEGLGPAILRMKNLLLQGPQV